jgi:hypothetical protein
MTSCLIECGDNLTVLCVGHSELFYLEHIFPKMYLNFLQSCSVLHMMFGVRRLLYGYVACSSCLSDNMTEFLQHQSKHWLFCGNLITSSWFRCSLNSYFSVSVYSVFTCTFNSIFLLFDLLPCVCYSCRLNPLITYAGTQSTGVCPKQHAALWRRRGCCPYGRATSLAKCCLLYMVLYRYCAFAVPIENVTSEIWTKAGWVLM